MGDKEWTPETVFDVLGDRLSRRILVAAAEQPMSADDIAATTDVSLPTVYRRLDALDDYGFLEKNIELDEEDGTQYRTFETAIDHIEVDFHNGGFAVDLALKQDITTQFEAFWGELERSTISVDIGPDGISEHVTDGSTDG